MVSRARILDSLTLTRRDMVWASLGAAYVWHDYGMPWPYAVGGFVIAVFVGFVMLAVCNWLDRTVTRVFSHLRHQRDMMDPVFRDAHNARLIAEYKRRDCL